MQTDTTPNMRRTQVYLRRLREATSPAERYQLTLEEIERLESLRADFVAFNTGPDQRRDDLVAEADDLMTRFDQQLTDLIRMQNAYEASHGDATAQYNLQAQIYPALTAVRNTRRDLRQIQQLSSQWVNRYRQNERAVADIDRSLQHARNRRQRYLMEIAAEQAATGQTPPWGDDDDGWDF